MNYQFQLRKILMCIIAIATLEMSPIIVAHTKIIYGPRAGLTVKKLENSNCILQLGLFSTRKKALQYQKRFTKYIKTPAVYISYINHSDRYAVVIGPIKDIETLHQVSYKAAVAQFKSNDTMPKLSVSTQSRNSFSKLKSIKTFRIPVRPPAYHKMHQQLEWQAQPKMPKNSTVLLHIIPNHISINKPKSAVKPHSIFSRPKTLVKSSGVVTFSLGPVWENAGQAQTFYLTSDIEKTYTANNFTHVLMDGEVFLGIQRPLRKKWRGQIGLALAMTSSASLSGDIWDDTQSEFNNYIYNYKIKHTHLALKGKVLMNKGYVVTPWVSGSLGVGFNQAYDFSNTPTISQAVTTPNFANNTTTALTYTLGAGIERKLNPHWQVGIGYEFADWGNSQLGSASGQILNSGLSLSHLFTNGFLFNLTYLV